MEVDLLERHAVDVGLGLPDPLEHGARGGPGARGEPAPVDERQDLGEPAGRTRGALDQHVHVGPGDAPHLGPGGEQAEAGQAQRRQRRVDGRARHPEVEGGGQEHVARDSADRLEQEDLCHLRLFTAGR